MADNFNKITPKGDQSLGKEGLLTQNWWAEDKILDLEDLERANLNVKTTEQVKTTRWQLEFLNPEEAKEYFAQKVWSYLHEDWRKKRLNYWPVDEFKKWETVIKINWIEYVFNGTENGRWKFIITEAGKETAKQLWKDYEASIRYDYSPRMKPAKDEKWEAAHWWEKELDIANTRFEDLSSAWQRENLEAGRVAVNLVYEKVVNGEEITPEMIEEMSSIVHDEWMKRNPWNKEREPEKFVPYEELPEEEKAKDRDQILRAIEIIKSEK